MVTSSTAKPTRLARGMVTFEDGCAVCCNGGGMAGAKGSERPIIAGPTNGLPTVGCCPWRQNTSGRAQSYHYETTDWRAGCGRSASPVRREGQGSIPCPYPYRPCECETGALGGGERVEVVAGFGVIGLQTEGFLVLSEGVGAFAFAFEGEAEVVVGLGVLGLEVDDGVELGDGVVELACLEEAAAQALVATGVGEVAEDVLAELLEGFGEFVLLGEGVAEVGVGVDVVGV